MFMVNTERQPKGIPAGGQFAPSSHDEAGSPLELSDEEYNKDGSFFYPPFPRSAEQLIAFYDGQNPSEEQISKIAGAYRRRRAEIVGIEMELHDAEAVRRHGVNTKAAEDEHYRWMNHYDQLHPVYMPPLFAKDISKAVQLWRFSGVLPPEEEREVLDYEIQLRNGQRFTVESLAQRYLAGRYDADLSS